MSFPPVGGLKLSIASEVTRSVWHLLLVFVARHWVLAVANAGLTALLGLGLLRLAAGRSGMGSRVPLDSWGLRLRRFLLVAALCKGTFYLILGDSHRMVINHSLWVGYGFQVPNPRDLLRLDPQTIWRPTTASEQVGLLLVGVALFLLLRRARQVAILLSGLEALARIQRPAGKTFPHVFAAMGRVASGIGLSPGGPLPRLLLAEVAVPTPFLVGLRRPFLLLSPVLADTLTDEELDAMLRHEFAHFCRRDHWWRWLLLWVEDVGRVNPVSSWLSLRAMDGEEDICDRQAVSSAGEAAALARAIAKAQAQFAQAVPSPGEAALGQALPQLLGRAGRGRVAVLERRLERLLALSRQRAPGVPSQTGQRCSLARWLAWRCWMLLLTALVLVICYTKFFFIININP